MAIKCLSSKGFVYESKLDPDKGTEKATKFKIRTLPVRLVSYLNDKSSKFHTDNKSGETTVEFNGNQVALDFVRFGVEGWENLVKEDGSPAEPSFKKERVLGKEWDVLEDSCLDSIPFSVLSELAKVVTDGNTTTEEERKNSEG